MNGQHYKAILFDLDGTLTDPQIGITRSVAYALKRFGIFVDDIETLIPFIGPPLPNSFKKYYQFNDNKARQAVVHFRERFAEKGLLENRMYSSVPELLDSLHSVGKKLVLATSKATVFAQRILDHFDIGKYFHFVAGSNYDLTRIEKSEIIEYAMSHVQGYLPEEIVMVGDHVDDILGAYKNRIDSIAVFYGYGKRLDLERARPTHSVCSVEELKILLAT
jgi:phosphoglycolate phosphatase